MNQNSDNAKHQRLKYQAKVKKTTVITTALGILLYFADVISDIVLAVKYYNNGHKIFFSLTLFLVVLSAVVSSLLSFYMYYMDNKDSKCKVSKKSWIFRAIFLIFGIAPVLRNFDALCYAWKSYRSKNKAEKIHYAEKMSYEITDSLYLRLYEAFLESGPQLILQMYIFAETQLSSPNTFTETEIKQTCTMLISAISISSAIVAYANSLLDTSDHKNELKLFRFVLLFLWRFFEILSRIIAMSFGLSASPYILVVFFIQFIITSGWIYFTTPDTHNQWNSKKVYQALLHSVLWMFVFLNHEHGPTKKRLFYGAMFVENTAIMIFWIYFSSPHQNLLIPVVITQLLSFCLSIVFMAIYHKYFLNPVVTQSNERSQENCLNASEAVIQNGQSNREFEIVQSDNKTTEI